MHICENWILILNTYCNTIGIIRKTHIFDQSALVTVNWNITLKTVILYTAFNLLITYLSHVERHNLGHLTFLFYIKDSYFKCLFIVSFCQVSQVFVL